jgi:arginine kinase
VDEAVNRFLEGPPSGSLLSKYLSRDIYASLRTAVTRAFHSSLWDVIRSGLSRPESELGLYAPDAEAYDTFGALLLPVIRDYHRLEGFLQHPASYWGEEQGAAGGIGVFSSPHVVSTRIRLARSIAGTGAC